MTGAGLHSGSDGRPLRVGHVIDSLGTGGAQQGLVTFASLARARSIRVTVVSLAADPDTLLAGRLRAAGARVEAMPGRGLRDPARLLALTRYLLRERVDVVHTHLQYANILGVLAARLAGIPVVGGLHLADVDSFGQRPVTEAIERLALAHGADALTAVGREVALAHQRRLHRSIDVLPNASLPAEPLSADERQVLRAALCGSASRPLIISVGRLRPVKGFGDLLFAFTTVRRVHPDAALVIVGSGPLRPALESERDALGLSGHAFFTGQREDVRRILACADLYVSASQMEGLPQTVLEAMMAGLGVVATAVGDVPTVVTPDLGVVIPARDPGALADALCGLLADPDRRARLGAAAREHVTARHDARVWVERTLEVYERCVSGKRR